MYLTAKEEIQNWMDTHSDCNYVINDDLTVDVMGDIEIHQWTQINELKVKFRNVHGNFDCSQQTNLVSLEGVPDTLGCKMYIPPHLQGDFHVISGLDYKTKIICWTK